MDTIPSADTREIRRVIERELTRPQTNRVLHAHPSPLLWDKEEIDFSQHCRERLRGEGSAQRRLGVYLSIPFCIPTDPPHCGFCLFPTEDYRGKNSADLYLDYLDREAELLASFHPDCAVSSIYVGGGTPNLLRGAQYARLLAAAERIFGSIPADIEITLEGIPQLYNEERVKAIRDAGFNRVSMGVQQIDDGLIKYSGRNQTRKQIFDAIGYFQKHGLAFNVDLIFGWPEQTLEQMRRDLRALVDTGIRHITHYELNIGGVSDFALSQRKNLPPRDVVEQMYRESRALLLESGFQQRTVYDWERPETEAREGVTDRSHEYVFEDELRDFFAVEEDEIVHTHEMLGVGYAAISFTNGYPYPGGTSWTTVNSRALKRYYEGIDAGRLPIEAYYFRSPVDVKISWLFQALQETRIEVARYNAIFSGELLSELEPLWDELTRLGWVEIRDGTIQVGVDHHLKIPIVQTLIAAKRREQIVEAHRAKYGEPGKPARPAAR